MVLLLLFYHHSVSFNRYLTVPSAILVMVLLFVDSATVMMDGMYASRKHNVISHLFSVYRVGDTCECASSNISTDGCP